MGSGGCDADEIPEGHGEFGLEVNNLIPARGVLANEIYLSSLRTENGEPIKWKRIGSFGAYNIENPIDGYLIFNAGEKQIAITYISPYHQKIPNKAPKGYIILKK